MDITVWDKDAGKKDDFMGRYSSLHQSLNFLLFYQMQLCKIRDELDFWILRV